VSTKTLNKIHVIIILADFYPEIERYGIINIKNRSYDVTFINLTYAAKETPITSVENMDYYVVQHLVKDSNDLAV
jgi:hypothetical protein